MDYGLGTLITSPVEHSAVREPAMALQEAGLRVEYLRVDHQGVIDADHLQSLLQEIIDGVTASAALSRTAPAPHSLGPILVSVQWANNETGVLQPIEQISHIVGQAKDAAKQAGHRMKVYFHVDATQAAGKMPLNVKTAEVDLATFSAHKFHGPKGIAALYVGTGVRVRAINRGGPQEREKRGGTENVPGIMGMGVAAEQAAGFVEDHNRLAELTALRDRFEQMLRQAVPNMVVNSGQASTGRLWNTSNLAFPGLEAEAILLGLSERGVCASAGAACSSGSLEPSPVLRAMGIADPVAHGSVRFSLSRYTTLDEIKEAARIIPAIVERLGRTMPMGV